MDIHGNPWIFMDIHRNPWKSMDIQEYSSISKISWIFPDIWKSRISIYPWKSMCTPELPYMDIQHGTPRKVGRDQYFTDASLLEFIL